MTSSRFRKTFYSQRNFRSRTFGEISPEQLRIDDFVVSLLALPKKKTASKSPTKLTTKQTPSKQPKISYPLSLQLVLQPLGTKPASVTPNISIHSGTTVRIPFPPPSLRDARIRGSLTSCVSLFLPSRASSRTDLIYPGREDTKRESFIGAATLVRGARELETDGRPAAIN